MMQSFGRKRSTKEEMKGRRRRRPFDRRSFYCSPKGGGGCSGGWRGGGVAGARGARLRGVEPAVKRPDWTGPQDRYDSLPGHETSGGGGHPSHQEKRKRK